jgi:serine/threonine protein kinase
MGKQEYLQYMKDKEPFLKKRPIRQLIPSAPPSAIDLISKLLTFDPDHRLSAEEALFHPFFESLNP